MINHKEIIWEESHKENITTRFGRVNGVTMFTMVKFTNEKYPNENWVMTSNVTPMNMVKNINPVELEVRASSELVDFIYKIIE